MWPNLGKIKTSACTGLKITDPGRNHFVFVACKSDSVGLQIPLNSNVVMSMAVIRE